MPDQPQNSDGQTPVTPSFVKKPVDMPILDAGLRSQIAPAPVYAESVGGFRGFYKANKLYFWAILAGAVVIAGLSYIAFRKTPVVAPKQANVSINVDVPDTVQSGSDAVYKITVQNNDTQDLVNTQLELTYPDGETYDSSSPPAQNLSGNLFTINGGVPHGQNVVVIVKAKVTGNVNDQKTLGIKLYYSYSNFNSQFEADQTSTITLAASNLSIQLQGPDNTSNAQLVMYTISYANNSSADVQNARVQMDYPDGFAFASSNPPPDLGSNTWDIGTLAKGGSGQIQIQGAFSSANPGETKTATAQFLIQGQDGSYYTQNSSQYATNISSLPLLVQQQVQPANSTGVINPGDSLTFNVSYTNNASVAATGVNIEVDLDSKVINPASITAQGAQINNNTIIWNAAGVPQLQSLLPNQSGQLSFNLKVNSPATKDASTNLTVVSAIKIKSNEYATAFPGNQLTLNVSSPSSINTGLAFISGSLPPQVGKSTVYQVSLSLINSSNNFSSGVLTAFIPAAAFSQSSVSSLEANNVQYDPSTSKLTWNFGSLPANTGRFTKPRTLTFNLTANPGASDAGQILTLLKTINFTATDLFTNQPVSVSVGDIHSTDLQGQSGYGYGTVQQ